MKFLLPLLSFFLGNAKSLFKEPSVALTQQLVLHVRTITILLTSAIGSLALSCVGVSLFIASIAKQADLNEDFTISPAMCIYLAMTVIFAGILFYSLRRKTWLSNLGFEEKPAPAKQSGALENAIALLVMDFVEERQSRRKEPTE